MGNRLYFGDNLHVLRKYIKDESVDLIYLDPPFNSNAAYNLVFKAPSASGHRAQIQAFDDTWTWGEEAEQALDEIIAHGGPCSALVQTFRSALGANDLTAYLVMMTVRLVVRHCQRNPEAPATHDLYRHTDGNIYRKDNCRAPGDRGPRYDWNGHNQHWRFSPEERDRLIAEGRIVYSKTGMPRVLRPIDPEKGAPLQDVWTDIDAINSGSAEILGYPTQKPISLLERILLSSSREGDVVLDPFCGCGTAVSAAEKLGRSWIGIDITHLAIHVIADRLGRDAPSAQFEIFGQPTDLAGAEKLAEIDKYQFQWWATWLCGGQPFGGERKGRDRGIDGTLEFVSRRGQQDWGIISVKGGKQVGPAMVRDLAGTVAREKASLGVFICLAEPSKEMEREAVLAGFVELGGSKYRKIQIRTVEQLLAGKAIDSPYLLTTAQEAPAPTKAPRVSKKRAIAPKELQKQRSFLLPITGGLQALRQKDFSFGEPQLVTPRPTRKKA